MSMVVRSKMYTLIIKQLHDSARSPRRSPPAATCGPPARARRSPTARATDASALGLLVRVSLRSRRPHRSARVLSEVRRDADEASWFASALLTSVRFASCSRCARISISCSSSTTPPFLSSARRRRQLRTRRHTSRSTTSEIATTTSATTVVTAVEPPPPPPAPPSSASTTTAPGSVHAASTSLRPAPGGIRRRRPRERARVARPVAAPSRRRSRSGLGESRHDDCTGSSRGSRARAARRSAGCTGATAPAGSPACRSRCASPTAGCRRARGRSVASIPGTAAACAARVGEVELHDLQRAVELLAAHRLRPPRTPASRSRTATTMPTGACTRPVACSRPAARAGAARHLVQVAEHRRAVHLGGSESELRERAAAKFCARPGGHRGCPPPLCTATAAARTNAVRSI